MIRPSKDAERILRDDEAINRAMKAARRRAVLHHRRFGVPLVVWKDGEIVELPPDSVELPEDRGPKT